MAQRVAAAAMTPYARRAGETKMADKVKQECQVEGPQVERTQSGVTYTPRVDILETDDQLTLYADLPGVALEDLDIHFEDRQLTIFGRLRPQHEGVKYLREEYGVGDFYRVFAIGQDINPSKISAEMSAGVVRIHLPKADVVKPRKIAVTSS
jgi:HSP20 family protein